MRFENLWARGLHEQQFDYHLRVSAESVSEHDQSETESMVFLQSGAIQSSCVSECILRFMKGKFLLVESEILGFGIRNPSSTDKDWNSVSEIRNPQRGMKNPRLAWIPHIPLRGATP